MSELLALAANVIVDDVAHVEAAIPGMDVARLDRGRDQTELTLVDLGGIGLCAGRFDFKVSTEAGFDDVRLGLQLDEGSGSWNGQPFDCDRLWVYGPGSEHSGAAAPNGDGRGATWVTFTAPGELVAESSEPDVGGRCDIRTVAVADLEPLRTPLRDVVTQVRNNTFTGEHARRVERELLEATSTALLAQDRDTASVRSRHRITRRCIAVADDLDPIPTTAELAAALDITDRWVRAAFAGAYGVSVSDFFRARALHRARRALTAADPTSTSVTDVAMACGFWHLGRFSGYYRSHFGELPRRTLQRQS
jgi:AraC-like DNA-binding protein